MIPYRRAVCGFSSTLSLTTSSLSACSAAIASSTGETWWHGPHHCAQYSTMTGLGFCSTSASNPASVTTLAGLISLPPARDVAPEARRTAVRLVVPEARKPAQREAWGSGGLPGDQQSLAAGAAARSDAAFGPAAAACHDRG